MADGVNGVSGTATGAPAVVVKEGDTLEKIAKQYGTTVGESLKANPGIEPTKLQIGQSINITHPAIVASKANIDQAIEYGYGEDYEFSLAENADVILVLRKGKTLGEIREDFQIEPGSLSRTNNVKGRFKPNTYLDTNRCVHVNDYDRANVEKGEQIVVERLQFKPNPHKSKLSRVWHDFWH
jgi:phage tail protein X